MNEMTIAGAATNERELLRARMRDQRLLIAERLGPAPGEAPPQRDYPRSKTMRLLMQHPMVAAGIVTRLAPLLIGSRLTRSLAGSFAVALSVAGAVRAVMNSR